MKLTVRDLLWLLLLSAALTTWGIGHTKRAKQIAKIRTSFLFVRIDGDTPMDEEVKRQVALKKFSRLTDDELDAHLAAHLQKHDRNRELEFEPCLVEMAHRGLAGRLQQHYDALMADVNKRQSLRFPDNLELLTSLRRAQGKPDPLILQLSLNNRPPWAASFHGPCLSAVVRNVDVGEEAVFFLDGCDDRGGRRERWRFVMTDEKGRAVGDSNYAPFMGGGVGTFGPLVPGGTGSRFNFSDLRKYVAPPPSGKYRLQAFYHNNVSIADQRDLSGLVVSKSEPIWVIVDNPTPLEEAQQPREMREPLAILAICAGLMLMASISTANPRSASETPDQPRGSRRIIKPQRRDLCWGVLVAAVAFGLWTDRLRQATKLVKPVPHAAADWSIRLANEDSP